MAGLGVLVVVLGLLVWAVTSVFGGGGGEQTADGPKLPQLPRGGRKIFPRYRVVAFYGAPQNQELGILGIGTPRQATTKLDKQAAAYDTSKGKKGRAKRREPEIMPALELIAVTVQPIPGTDGKFRDRQTPATIDTFLKEARRKKALLILDIQPGQADFMDEVKYLEPWLQEPDVGLALDSEWSMKPGEIPGQVFGSMTAAKVNEVSAYLERIIKRRKLPEKILLTHQFTPDMIQNRDQIVPRHNLAIVLNVDGIGAPQDKVPKFNELADPRARKRRSDVHMGFKLFYKEDAAKGGLMQPDQVLQLKPQPQYIVYE